MTEFNSSFSLHSLWKRDGLWKGLREVLVVALGILVAFSLDALWDGAQERNEVERLLAAVESELQVNIDALNRSIAIHQGVINAGVEILALTGPAPGPNATGAVGELLPDILPTHVTALSSTAVSSALASGTLGSLRDDLRTALTMAPGVYRRLTETEEQSSQVVAVEILPVLGQYVPRMNLWEDPPRRELGALPMNSRFAEDLEGLLADMDFENAVQERVLSALTARNGCQLMESQAEQVLLLLRARAP